MVKSKAEPLEDSRRQEIEELLAFWKSYDQIMNEHEVWLWAAGKLGIPKSHRGYEKFCSDGFYNSKLRTIYTLSKSRNFIEGYSGDRISFEELKLKREAALTKVKKIIFGFSLPERRQAVYDVRVEKEQNVLFSKIQDSIKEIESYIRRYPMTNGYTENYRAREKRLEKQCEVLSKVKILLLDLDKTS